MWLNYAGDFTELSKALLGGCQNQTAAGALRGSAVCGKSSCQQPAGTILESGSQCENYRPMNADPSGFAWEQLLKSGHTAPIYALWAGIWQHRPLISYQPIDDGVWHLRWTEYVPEQWLWHAQARENANGSVHCLSCSFRVGTPRGLPAALAAGYRHGRPGIRATGGPPYGHHRPGVPADGQIVTPRGLDVYARFYTYEHPQ